MFFLRLGRLARIGEQVYRMPILPCFHWKMQQKKCDMRAPPAGQIMHYA
jgi:hypothetical protein